MLNSNAMDIVPVSDRLSWRLTGGIVDLFLLTGGPSPSHVLDQLTQVVGRPAMMPSWSLGWQQSKYGYPTLAHVEAVVANYSKAGIPLEVMYTDIDHMDHWKDFTFDPVNYPVERMKAFVQKLHGRGQKWVPIVDPGIKVESGYYPYDLGIQRDVFVKKYDGKEALLGWVWAGPTHYPDFLSPRGQAYFTELLRGHHDTVPWDGIWIDMDEVSNFCTGDDCQFHHSAINTDLPPWVCQLDCSHDVRPHLNDSQRPLLDPPYAVASSLAHLALGVRTMSVLATHLDGRTIQYNAHNIYALSECQTTYKAVANITNQRPFILTRSSFSGVGSYAAHWTGDNAATWGDMALSLHGIINYGMFGMPMGGADVCGFLHDTGEELCARWVALAALAYPFARSHSDLHATSQEPYRWESVAATARTCLHMRYSLLSYWYSLHRLAHARGIPILRPLWWDYPHVTGVFGDEDGMQLTTVLVGTALLVVPVLQPGVEEVTGYFPSDGDDIEGDSVWWWNMFDHGDRVAGGGAHAVRVPLQAIPLYVKSGSIIAMHDIESYSNNSSNGMGELTTSEVRKSPLTLLVVVSAEARGATGWAFMDGGDTVHVGNHRCNFLKFSSRAGELRINFGKNELFEMETASDRGGGDDGSDASNCEDFEWPGVSKVRVLGDIQAMGGGLFTDSQVGVEVRVMETLARKGGSGVGVDDVYTLNTSIMITTRMLMVEKDVFEFSIPEGASDAFFSSTSRTMVCRWWWSESDRHKAEDVAVS